MGNNPVTVLHAFQVVSADELDLIQSADTAVREGNYMYVGTLASGAGFMVLSLNAGDHSYYLRYRSEDSSFSVAAESVSSFFTVEALTATRLNGVNIHTQSYRSTPFTIPTGNVLGNNDWPEGTATVTVSQPTPTLVRAK
jgi:hypothetical protein